MPGRGRRFVDVEALMDASSKGKNIIDNLVDAIRQLNRRVADLETENHNRETWEMEQKERE